MKKESAKPHAEEQDAQAIGGKLQSEIYLRQDQVSIREPEAAHRKDLQQLEAETVAELEMEKQGVASLSVSSLPFRTKLVFPVRMRIWLSRPEFFRRQCCYSKRKCFEFLLLLRGEFCD